MNNNIQLDTKCWQCNSKVLKPDEVRKDENGNCEYCGGVGFTLTDNGRSILEFIKRYKIRWE